jgi:hypothetical protein
LKKSNVHVAEASLSTLSVPRLRTTVAVLQEYEDPRMFSVVDVTLALRLCKLDQQACQAINLIDGKRSIQEIGEKAAGLTKIRKTKQELLEFFTYLRSRRVLEF